VAFIIAPNAAGVTVKATHVIASLSVGASVAGSTIAKPVAAADIIASTTATAPPPPPLPPPPPPPVQPAPNPPAVASSPEEDDDATNYIIGGGVVVLVLVGFAAFMFFKIRDKDDSTMKAGKQGSGMYVDNPMEYVGSDGEDE
jgi:hypothetical protein